MFKHKQHLFFDLDHTLWDYEANSTETLNELWDAYKLQNWAISLPEFLATFTRINEGMWDDLHAGKISKDIIRNERFPRVLAALNIVENTIALKMQAEYIDVCPTKPYLVDGVKELLEAIHGKYEMHIITNGFDEIQGVKLKSGGIGHYFTHVITSGMVGYQKPDRQIFDYAMNLAKSAPSDSLMIGDNPVSDIHGAYLAGIDQVFYNPNKLICPVSPTLEVRSMRDLIPQLV